MLASSTTGPRSSIKTLLKNHEAAIGGVAREVNAASGQDRGFVGGESCELIGS